MAACMEGAVIPIALRSASNVFNDDVFMVFKVLGSWLAAERLIQYSLFAIHHSSSASAQSEGKASET